MQNSTAIQVRDRSPSSPEQCDRMLREYRARIQPWIDLKLSVTSLVMPTIVIEAQNRKFISTSYDPDTQKLLDAYDVEIQKITDEFNRAAQPPR